MLRFHAFAAAMVSAGLVAMPSPIPAQVSKIQPRIQSSNLLGNGGFEVWNHGHGIMASVPPDLWYPMGQTDHLLQQNFIAITRVSEDLQNPGAPWSARLTANQPQNYISQTLENGREFRGEKVTFAVDFRTTFAVAQPTLEVFDGVTSTQKSQLVILGQDWVRVSVCHNVSADANRVELRIYPDQTVDVDHAMALVGCFEDASYVPRGNPEPALVQLPLGSVIDWYRMDAGIPVPEGFAIADGSVVADPDSPFRGLNVPNLSDRFVLGVTDVAAIGAVGGVASHVLSHSHGMSHTHSGTMMLSNNFYFVQGLGPLQVPQQNSTHPFTTGGPSQSNTGSALGTIDNRPPYVGLLKIMRIK